MKTTTITTTTITIIPFLTHINPFPSCRYVLFPTVPIVSP
jgi:hypothetical protein